MVKWSVALLGAAWALGAPALAQIDYAAPAPAIAALQAEPEPAGRQPTHTSLLPLGAGRLSESDRAELPLPIGLSFDYFDTTETMLLRNASVSINGQPIPSGMLNLESLVTVSFDHSVRADVWLLPFLNLYLAGGTFSGTAKNINASITGMPLPIPPEVPYSGTTRGLGATLAGVGQFDYKLKAIPESAWNYIVGAEIDIAKGALLLSSAASARGRRR